MTWVDTCQRFSGRDERENLNTEVTEVRRRLEILKKLQEVKLLTGKVGVEQPSGGAETAITRLSRLLFLARNPCPLFSCSNYVQCPPLGHPLCWQQLSVFL